MSSIQKFFYINLSRRPDRNSHFLKEAAKAEIPFEKIERIEGVDGKKLQISQMSQKEISLFRKTDYNHLPYYKGIMGNQLAHFRLWRKIINENIELSVIFQDDVMFTDSFMEKLNKIVEELPNDTEIVWIGQHKRYANEYFEPWPLDKSVNEYPYQICDRFVTNHIGKYKKGINPCSLAYIITLQGAKNIVQDHLKRGFLRATDGNMNDYLESKDLTYSTIEVLCTGNTSLGTDVFK